MNMKKNLLILILILVTGGCMIYAYTKAKKANELIGELKNEKVRYDQLQMEAVRQAELSMEMREQAKKQEAIALELADRLTECETK